MEFKEGQLVVYKRRDEYVIGKIKRIKDSKRAWIWYTSGDTAELTSLDLVTPIINDYCIKDLISKS